MINLVTGLPGSGKTLFTIKTVNDYLEKENKSLIAQGKPVRQIFYHGIPELTLPNWQLMESPEDWIKLPSHSIIVIDECQSTFRPRAASVKPPPYIAEFETHRHKGLDFFLLTQHPMLVDGNIRRLAGKHYHVVRFYGFQKSTIHEFQQVRDNVDKNQKNSIETHFIYPKEVFNWYKSADAHTVKKRIPMRMIMVVILPVILVFVGYMAFNALKNIQTKPTEMMKNVGNTPEKTIPSDATPLINKPAAAAPVAPVVTAANYEELHKPMRDGLPHTAPIYQALITPVRAPVPAACVVMASKGCHCYSEQGTKLEVSVSACMNIVKGGFYVDWKTDERPVQSSANSGDAV